MVWGVLGGIYYLGVFIALFVFPARVNGGGFASPLVYLMAWQHPPSRRNGIPWVIKTIGKAFVWPAVFGLWQYEGRPPSPVLFGGAAADKLGLPEPGYETNGFATKWTAKP